MVEDLTGDLAEAEAAIERLAAAPADDGLVIRDIWLLRLRALVARAQAMPRLTRTSGIATATWRKRLASRGNGVAEGMPDGGCVGVRASWSGVV